MMRNEFEYLVKMEVTEEQYTIIEQLYLLTDMDKVEFSKKMKPFVSAMKPPVVENKPMFVFVQFEDEEGYYFSRVMEMVDADIPTGRPICKFSTRHVVDENEVYGYYSENEVIIREG